MSVRAGGSIKVLRIQTRLDRGALEREGLQEEEVYDVVVDPLIRFQLQDVSVLDDHDVLRALSALDRTRNARSHCAPSVERKQVRNMNKHCAPLGAERKAERLSLFLRPRKMK